MADILEQFLEYKYDYETKVIVKKNHSTSNVKELINITELLDTHNIRYSIENENIKLHFWNHFKLFFIGKSVIILLHKQYGGAYDKGFSFLVLLNTN
jgi:hypothetical protein